MASDVQIANYALTMLGDKRINALDENTEEARACNAVYTLIRDACLSEHEWNFSVSRATLGLLSSEPVFEWDYQFQLPNDCLRVIYTDLSDASDWKIEGRYLLTDSSSVNIKYVAQITDSTKFSPMFVKYLAARLAEELAFPLTGSRSLESDMYSKAEKIKINAFGLDSVEGTPDQPKQDDWFTERF